MKRLNNILIIFFALILIFSVSSYAKSVEFNVTSDASEITDSTKEINVTINLGKFEDFEEKQILGFEGFLNYDKNVFSKVSMAVGNNWNVVYNKETNKFLADTASAKSNSEVLVITMELNKDLKNIENTKIELNNILLTDGNDFEMKFNKSLDLKFRLSNNSGDGGNTGGIIDNVVFDAKEPISNYKDLVKGLEWAKEDKNQNIIKTDDETTVKSILPAAGAKITIFIIIAIVILRMIRPAGRYLKYKKDTNKQI